MTNDATVLTETTYLERRSDLNRQIAAAHGEHNTASLKAALSGVHTIAANAREVLDSLQKQLESLEIAWRQSEWIVDTAEAGRRRDARIKQARTGKAAHDRAARHASKIQSLIAKMQQEFASYKEATGEALAIAHRLEARGQSPRDLLQPMAFFQNPEEGCFAAFVYSLPMVGVVDIPRMMAIGAFGDKRFEEVHRTRYGVVHAIIDAVLTEQLADAA